VQNLLNIDDRALEASLEDLVSGVDERKEIFSW
jgi:hypothetical protein